MDTNTKIDSKFVYIISGVCLVLNLLSFLNENYLNKIYDNSNFKCETQCERITSSNALINCLDACSSQTDNSSVKTDPMKGLSISLVGVGIFISLAAIIITFLMNKNNQSMNYLLKNNSFSSKIINDAKTIYKLFMTKIRKLNKSQSNIDAETDVNQLNVAAEVDIKLELDDKNLNNSSEAKHNQNYTKYLIDNMDTDFEEDRSCIKNSYLERLI